MKKHFFRVRFVLAMASIFAFSPIVTINAAPGQRLVELLREVNQTFRSNNFDLEPQVIYEQAFPKFREGLMAEFAKFDRGEVVDGLAQLADELNVSKAVAENLLKIHGIASNCIKGQCFVAGDHRVIDTSGGTYAVDDVWGLPHAQLQEMVSRFPDPSPSSMQPGEFDYLQYQIQHIDKRSILDTDWYFFKMAVAFFLLDMHEQEATFSLFARGSESRSYHVLAGLQASLDVVNNLRFTRGDIEYFRNHPLFASIPDRYRPKLNEFFKYLETWRLKADVRGMREGNVFFPNESVAEIKTDIFSHFMIESFLTSITGAASRSATATSLMLEQLNGVHLVEGGLRRTGLGWLSSLGALTAGALGTSHTRLSKLIGINPYGSSSHGGMLFFPSEGHANSAFGDIFPGSTSLVDTTGPLFGQKAAIASLGRSLAGLRTDSDEHGMDTQRTLKALREMFVALGFPTAKIGVSGKYDPKILAALRQKNGGELRGLFDWILSGSYIASPNDDGSGLGMVYKLIVKPGPDGKPMPIAKTSAGKGDVPGETQVVRFYDPATGQFTHDLRTRPDETIRGTGEPQLMYLQQKSGWRLPWQSPLDGAKVARASVARLSAAVRGLAAKRGDYLVKSSPRVALDVERLQTSKLADPIPKPKIGVFFGSFDGATQAHIEAAINAQILFDLDRVVFVPTGEHPVHGRNYKFDARTRTEGLRLLIEKYMALERERHPDATPAEVESSPEMARLRALKRISVDDIEQKPGHSGYSIDTLRTYQQADHFGNRADFHLITGADVFQSLRTPDAEWHEADQLSKMGHWVVVSRGGVDKLPEIPGLFSDYRKVSPRHWVSSNSSKTVRMIDVPRAGNISASAERAASAEIDTIFHGVDLGETFWEAKPGLRERGIMAVTGSDQITPNVVKLALLGKYSRRGKVILTKDYHLEAEIKDHRINREFAPDGGNFPGHGREGMTGPAGHETIREVQDLFEPAQWLRVPHHWQIITRTGPNDTDVKYTLQLEPWDFDANLPEVLRKKGAVMIEKNGPNSYDFGVNPRSRLIVDAIKPKKVVVFGVATDFCVLAAVLKYLEWGYDVELVEDAIAHIFDGEVPGVGISKTNNKVAAYAAIRAKAQAAGRKVEFTTTEKVIEQYLLSVPSEFHHLFKTAPCVAAAAKLAAGQGS